MRQKGKFTLKSSLCSKCGYCCFQCEYLGEHGCTNPEYAKNTICESFPVMFGDPEKLGYEIRDSKKGTRWFIAPERHCKILNHTYFSNKLKEIVNEINTQQKELKRLMKSDQDYLYVFYSP